MNNIDGGQVWYYYDVPEAQPKQTSQVPVSQIPVLNGVQEEEVARPPPRRGGEGITSKYITLAKAGGRKDLLLYRNNVASDEGKEYSRVDWFDHPDTNTDLTVGKPRLRHPNTRVTNNTNLSGITMLTTEAPFGTDKFLVWNKNDAEDQEQYLTREARRQRQLNRSQDPPAPLPLPDPLVFTNRQAPKPPLGEIEDPVSFSHLLSHGYQADWNKNMSETRKEKMDARRRDVREQKEKLTKHLTSIKKEPEPVADKPLFKIKKFSNIAPKVINS